MPPEKNMVKTIMPITCFFPSRSGRDRGYAHREVQTRLMNVPREV